MDVLSDVLQAVHLTGAVFFRVEASAPWAAEAPSARELGPLVMPRAQHLMEYHVLLEGTCWAGLVDADAEPVRLTPGSVIVFPQGHRHVVSSAPRMRAQPDLALYRRPSAGAELPFRLEQHGGGAPTASLICGFLGCDRAPFNPLIGALPPCLHVAGLCGPHGGWLRDLIAATLAESEGRRIGRDSMLPRLSELIFIEALRRYLEAAPLPGGGWLAALADRRVGAALRLLHGDLARDWSLAQLALQAGTSRTVLSERFRSLLGVAPMTYLLRWRMQMAAEMLTGGSASVEAVAARVGYRSESAFSRAFHRVTGQRPAAWRRWAADEVEVVDRVAGP